MDDGKNELVTKKLRDISFNYFGLLGRFLTNNSKLNDDQLGNGKYR